MIRWTFCKTHIFQSTLLIRGATLSGRNKTASFVDFNPRSSYEERRTNDALDDWLDATFQSTLLIRGATKRVDYLYRVCEFQSTLLIRGATCQLPACTGGFQISIHAPHTRSDLISPVIVGARGEISIHAPHTRSDYKSLYKLKYMINFNPRSSYEERRYDCQHDLCA